MRRYVALVVVAGLLVVAGAPAFDAVGTIKKVDAEKRILDIHANGQDRTVKIAADAKVLGSDGKPLADGLKAKELKEGAEVTVTVERVDGGTVITAIRVGRVAGNAPALTGKPTVGLKPLDEMTATDRYKDEDGGLYGEGKNEPPSAHRELAAKETAKIAPLGADGRPAVDGVIGLVSINMSNATQEFSYFKQIADKDARKSARVVIVDCAQGGQAMAQWVDPKGRPWEEAERRLRAAKVDDRQVQVAWIKLANVRPTGDLKEHGEKLRKDTLTVIRNAKERFPNLRVAYLGSRIYGGYGTTPLNPEPYAYEGAFAVRWLIRDQIRGDAELAIGKAPVLLWGPYLWADGTTARKSDGLVWERADLAGDGTHPSQTGREKVAKLLLNFFTTDSTAKTWFVAKP